MNATFEPRRCPVCSAEIPVDAPQGLCPKCLLMGVASASGSLHQSSVADHTSSGGSGDRPRQAAKPEQNRREAPPLEIMTLAFPQLEILELIGRGGMGFVYKARQPKLDRFVAVKILPGHLANEPAFRERFEREARVLAKLQHPLIVSVYDFGEAAVPVSHAEQQSDEPAADAPSIPHERSYFYLMIEYVDGVNLREAMRAGRFTPQQALAVVPQVCEAMQHAF